jgi:hypothetical protein
MICGDIGKQFRKHFSNLAKLSKQRNFYQFITQNLAKLKFYFVPFPISAKLQKPIS